VSPRLEDYAIVGDFHTAALVGRNGSIDWLCLPRFDSGACFGALLGTSTHGRWQIAPVHEALEVRRSYRGDTLVLETDMRTEHGLVTLVDCMPPRHDRSHVVRMVVGRSGEVPMRMDLVIRFDYGTSVPWVRRVDGDLLAIAGPDALRLCTPVETHGEGLTTVASFTVREGQRIPFVLTWYPSHEDVPPRIRAEDAIEDTASWWRRWVGRCSHRGPWREAVVRSLITLEALTYRPTGGIVAAGTTSLPEKLGGSRNWDYRYCWLRDSTFTLYALMNSGYRDEATRWRQWLLRTVAGAPAQLQAVYGLAGERRLTEVALPWLPGYEGSRPVRIGNAAHEQFQLDVFGELMDAFHVARRVGLPTDMNAWAVERAFIEYVESAWREPDDGLWEIRGPRRHFTHSKVMAWVALDRAVKAVERFGLPGDAVRWRALANEIHAEVVREGFDERLGAFVQHYGSSHLDASLLMMPLVGFLPATDPRMRGTIEAIERLLMRDGFVQRYAEDSDVDGLEPGEGAFLLCSFWMVDNLALLGRRAEAQRLFERLLGLRNDVGLLSEEYDVAQARLVGNFPQAFSHVALVNSAYNLGAEVEGPAWHRPRR
jgi:GH15 family glucan-1,4-alpha-glucosidase